MKCFFRYMYSESLFLLMLDQRMKGICQWGKIVNKESPKDQTRKIYGYNIKQVLDAFVPSVNSNKFPSKRGKSDDKLLFNWLQTWHVWQSTIWICWRACNSVQKAWASLSFVSPWVKKRCRTVLSEHLKYLVLLLVEIVSLLAVQVFL